MEYIDRKLLNADGDLDIERAMERGRDLRARALVEGYHALRRRLERSLRELRRTPRLAPRPPPTVHGR